MGDGRGALMKKLFFTLLCAICVLAVNAQTSTRYLRVTKLDKTTVEIAVNEIDSIDFISKTTDTPDNPEIGSHEYVDLGLTSGTLWATCNVGATSPEQYGDYFAWGETSPKKDSDGNYTEYSWSTYKWCNGSSSTLTKYCTNSSYGTVDNKTVLDPEDDAATANWGGDWRMPTKAEQDELRTECTWEWTTLNGVNGYKVTSKAEGNTNSIFLPAAGYRDDSSLNGEGSDGYYWSSSLYESYPSYACSLGFSEGWGWSYNNRYNGRSVRPVCSSR